MKEGRVFDIFFVRHFRRITTSSLYIPEIDGLRFLAIVMVVMFHINVFVVQKNPVPFFVEPGVSHILARLFENGRHGVEAFFVISGFLLSLPFAKYAFGKGSKISLKAYFLRRLTRLEPPYIFAMTAHFFILLYRNAYPFDQLWPSFLASLAYLHNILPVGPSVNNVAWSLEIEIQFYLLAPFLTAIFFARKNIRRMLLLLIIFGMPIIQTQFPVSILTLYSYIQYFAAGLLLADIYCHEMRIVFPKLISILLGTLFLGIILLVSPGTLLGQLAFIVGLIGLYFLVLHDSVWKKIFCLRGFTLVGGMCYSIYLWHPLIISAVGNRTLALFGSTDYIVTLLIQSMILCVCILLFSTPVYILVERPCMDKRWPMKLKALIRSF